MFLFKKKCTTNDALLRKIYRTIDYGVICVPVPNAKNAVLQNSVANPMVRVSVKKENDIVTIDITDNGGGISDEILPKYLIHISQQKKIPLELE